MFWRNQHWNPKNLGKSPMISQNYYARAKKSKCILYLIINMRHDSFFYIQNHSIIFYLFNLRNLIIEINKFWIIVDPLKKRFWFSWIYPKFCKVYILSASDQKGYFIGQTKSDSIFVQFKAHLQNFLFSEQPRMKSG